MSSGEDWRDWYEAAPAERLAGGIQRCERDWTAWHSHEGELRHRSQPGPERLERDMPLRRPFAHWQRWTGRPVTQRLNARWSSAQRCQCSARRSDWPYPSLGPISRSTLTRAAVLALSRRNSNAAELLLFLHKLAAVLEEYFKELEEESIRDNFVIIYELLDEMMDFGYPQTTESKILQE